MNITEQLQFAEVLRSYLVEHLPPELLPVSGGRLSLDGLLPDGDSMSLQVTGGKTQHAWIDGSRVMELFFTIFYRSTSAVDDNDAKSAMQGVLNGIGTWMDEVMKSGEPPYFGEDVTVTRLELVQAANIADTNGANNQGLQFITYQAGYALGYETTA